MERFLVDRFCICKRKNASDDGKKTGQPKHNDLRMFHVKMKQFVFKALKLLILQYQF